MRHESVRDAQRCAQRLIYRFGVCAPEHIVIESFAARLGVAIVEAPLDGAIAQLVRMRQRAIIMVATHVTDPAARRFSIAHELGHLILGHPSRPEREFEVAADAFAAELLMPASLLRRTCEVSPVDLAVPRRIAHDYNVSILASAIRFTELASERCAAVLCEARKVKWCAPSPTFTRPIERGKLVDATSLAWDYFANGTLDAEPQTVPADAWLDTSADVEIIEHATCSPELGTVLSMLWVPERSAPQLGML